MYLHIGQSFVIPLQDILGIFDLDNASYSPKTRDFLKKAEQSGEVINTTDDLPKSFLICQDDSKKTKVYLSQLSSATLLKRAGSFVVDANDI